MENMPVEISVKNREKAIVKTSIIGIFVNMVLAGTKAMVGLFANSIAILLDAVNNLSDALSSVVAIIGAKLGAKSPNKKHPLGYGRIEYLSSMIVAAIVIYAGITSLVESVKKIIHPEKADYSMISIIIILVAVVVKILLGRFVKKQGQKHNSGALVASGTEALLDAILSVTVVISATIYMLWGLSLEAYVGVLIAIMIIKAGVDMMRDTLDDILGKRSDRDEIKRLKQIICNEPEVQGAYDLIMYNYGPNRNYATVHIELPDTMTVDEVDRVSRRVQEKVFLESGVVITGIGVYSCNTSDDEAAQIRNDVRKLVMGTDGVLQMHGFYIDIEKKTMRFDLVVSFEIDKNEVIANVTNDIFKKYPDYQLLIVPDIDV